MNTTTRLSASARQSVQCPTCLARRGSPCKGSRIPGASTLGGGWGGPVELRREHPARIERVRGQMADAADARGESDAIQRALESQIG